MQPTADKKESTEEYFSIGAVSQMTGINSITLRAWERRYNFFKPFRTKSGHRLYDRESIEKIIKAASLQEKGMSISQAAQLIKDPNFNEGEGLDINATWIHYRKQVLQAIEKFDESVMEDVYQQALSMHPTQTVTRQLIIPTLEVLGKNWDKSDTGIAEEHFFTAFLRNKLGARFHHRSRFSNGPKLVVSCLPGETHEIGLLLFALAADEQNYRQVLLGANMPLDQLPLTADKANANAIVISGKTPESYKQSFKALKQAVKASSVPVFIGGDVSVKYAQELKDIGCIPLGDKIDTSLPILKERLSRKGSLLSGWGF